MIVAAIVKPLHDHGFVNRPIGTLVELFDLSFARGEFILALGAQRPGNGCPWEALTRASSPAAVDAWLTTYRVDVPWMRDWATRAARGATQAAAEASAGVRIYDVVFGLNVCPEPDMIAIRQQMVETGLASTAIFDWMRGERPPDPSVETKAAFLERMSAAWDLRAAWWLGEKPPARRRELARHAGWFVRVHVLGESVSELLASEPDLNRDTVNKALKTFGALIEIPRN
ncbi:MAG: hypothetical protein R2712_31850 [Vicinamibacterales bacterium]